MNIAKPKSPLKGVGNKRVSFQFNRNAHADAAKAAFYDALPDEHKTKVGYRRQKGYFGWTTHISPEAHSVWLKAQK